jgi:outer membrane lipoprotein-sorting protein
MFLHIFKARWWILLNIVFIFSAITLGGMADCRAESVQSSLNEKEPTNLAPLKKALNRFFQYDRYQLSSETTMKATMEGSKVNIINKNQTMIVLPNQFRSEIQYEDKKYLVVSDGKTTWIYDPQKNDYAEMSAEQFQASEDSILVGLSSSFLLEIVRSLLTNQDNGSININQADLLQSITNFFVENYQDEGFIFKQTSQTIEGEDYLLYHYKSDAEKMEFILWVDAKTETLKKLQVLGGDQEIAVEITENIIEQNFNLITGNNTFRFIPTRWMTKVDTLPLEPF